MRLFLVLLLATMLVAAYWLYTPDLPRAELEAKYLSPADAYVDVLGVKLRVRDSGPRNAQTTLILLHGFGSSLETWEPWSSVLSQRFRVVRFDLPGFGLSGPDPTGDYSDARSVDVVAGLMARLGIAHAVVGGNSLGGKLAWMLAARRADLVEKLILISPDGFASPGFDYRQKPDVPFLMRLLPYTLPSRLLRMSLEPAYGNPAALTQGVLGRYRDLMLTPGNRAAMNARMQQVMLEDPVPLLIRIQAPTLILWGEQDAMIPFANAADYQRAMPRARVVPLPGLGHVPFEEAPERSLAPVLNFLS